MGYVKPRTIERLTLPSDANYWVDWKSRVAYGDIKAASEGATKIGPDGVPQIDTGAATDAMLLAYVADWNLTDENDQPLPQTPEGLAQLDLLDANFLSSRLATQLEAKATDEKNSQTISAPSSTAA